MMVYSLSGGTEGRSVPKRDTNKEGRGELFKETKPSSVLQFLPISVTPPDMDSLRLLK